MFSFSSDGPGTPTKLYREKLQRFYIPRTTGLLETVLSSTHAVDEENGPSSSTLLSDYDKALEVSSIVVSEVHNAPDDLGGELRRARHLAARYSIENARLRDQLKAHVLQASILTERLQADHAARRTRVADSPGGVVNSAASANPDPQLGLLGASPGREIEDAPPSHRAELEAKDLRIRELEWRMCELEGRVQAYEAAFQRGSKGEVASPRSASSPTTHELICQCLSGMEYLVKVCNAVEHCRNTPHGGGEEGGCPRPRRQCVLRCLRAAMRGNTEPAGEVLARGHQINDHTLMLSLREEIEYCETALVQTTARFFAEYSQPYPSPNDTARHPEDELGSASWVEKADEHVSVSDMDDCAVQ
ncbi:unnamed protein product [Phytomonas sp. Hart1]|nr:unnamed protein product [Phytomonas sp. Hart1]|eukprot:CCW68467.1 unnamed protein product [Phytomonas sp. isolate Hart1]